MVLVLFDFDGPIVDSAGNYHDFNNSLCSHYGIAPPWRNLDEFRRWVSGDWRENAERLGILHRSDETTILFNEHRRSNPPKLQQ